MQIYSALCYGAKEIVYYQFTDHTETITNDENSAKDNYEDAVVNGNTLETFKVYDYAKQALTVIFLAFLLRERRLSVTLPIWTASLLTARNTHIWL